MNTQPVITFVTRAELAKWAYGALSAKAMRRGRPRPMNDMWIAACCLTHGLPLATANVKDFVDFQAHHGLQLVTP